MKESVPSSGMIGAEALRQIRVWCFPGIEKSHWDRIGLHEEEEVGNSVNKLGTTIIGHGQ